MTAELDIERLLVALHALTGSWLSGDEAAQLMHAASSRDELVAHGIIDLDWLSGSPAARAQFGALAAAAALGPESADEDETVPPPATRSICMSREDALELVARFAQDPTAANLKTSLRRLAASAPGWGR